MACSLEVEIWVSRAIKFSLVLRKAPIARNRIASPRRSWRGSGGGGRSGRFLRGRLPRRWRTAANDALFEPLQQSTSPQVLPEVVATATRLPNVVSSAVVQFLVYPAFGWVDCAGGLCSRGELARRLGLAGLTLAGGAIGGEVGAVAGKAVATGAQALGVGVTQNAPTAVAIAMMNLFPDFAAGVLKDIGAPGAEQLEQSIMLEKAEEFMRGPGH